MGNKRRLLCFFTLLLSLILFEKVEAYNFISDGLYYNITSSASKTVGVTYKDTSYNSYSGDVIVPETITYNGMVYTVESIEAKAFYDCSELKSIKLPETITRINDNAFFECVGLDSIVIPKNVSYLGTSALHFKYGAVKVIMKSITPPTISSADAGSFNGAHQTIYVPKGTGHTYKNTTGWDKLFIIDGDYPTVVSIPNLQAGQLETEILKQVDYLDLVNELIVGGDLNEADLAVIKNRMPNLNHIDLGKVNISSLPEAYFKGRWFMRKIVLPNKLTKLPTSLLNNCYVLNSIAMAEGVIEIGDSAFYNCYQLPEVKIPTSVENIGKYAFYNCNKIADITLSDNVKNIDVGAFQWVSRFVTSITIPSSISEISSLCFANCTALKELILSANIAKIQSKAFSECSNLGAITCFAVNPPIVESDVFADIYSNAILYVPASSMTLYADADVWKNFNIQPITDDVKSINVSFPLDKAETYKNMTLEIVNTTSGISQKITTSGLQSYTFSGLTKNCNYNILLSTPQGVIIGEIKNVFLGTEDIQVTFADLLPLYDVELFINTPNGTDVRTESVVSWYDSNDVFISKNTTIKSVLSGTELKYNITLKDTLGLIYESPINQKYIVNDSVNEIKHTLVPYKKVILSGMVNETIGGVVSDATIVANQCLNGSNSKIITTKSDEKGTFELILSNVPTTIVISAPEYISEKIEIAEFTDTINLGRIILKPISGAVVSLSQQYISSVDAENQEKTNNWTPDIKNIAYTVYNVTQNKEIKEIVTEYSRIVLLEDVAVGDSLTITVMSKVNEFKPVKSGCLISEDNEGAVTLCITELGRLKASYNDADNETITGVLYDCNGELYKTQDYSDCILSVNNLADGNYSLVTMAKSKFFNSILKLSELKASALIAGEDYLINDVIVSSGVITVVSNDVVPPLDESKLYYTGDGTSFTVNKPTIVAGNYLTFKASLDFKEEYADKISNISLVIDLPGSCSFASNSVMVGKNIAPYQINGNTIEIPITDCTEIVKFCAVPSESGEFAPNAFAVFNYDGETIKQPIGSALFNVKDVSIIVPEITRETSVSVSGTAVGHSIVEIYDNDVLVGNTTALATGDWYSKIDLINAYNLSTHLIYAKIKTPQNVLLQTESKQCQYDFNAIKAEKVTMLNTIHIAGTSDEYEIQTVFDLINPENDVKYYQYWPQYPEFTFLIDFTENDVTKVSDVKLHVFCDDNSCSILTPTFDDKLGKWVASAKYNQQNLPVNVAVDFVAKTKYYIDGEYLDEICRDNDKFYSDYKFDIARTDSICELIDEEFAKDKLDYEKIETLINSINNSEFIVNRSDVDSLLSISEDVFDAELDKLLLEMDSLCVDNLFSVIDSVVCNYNQYGIFDCGKKDGLQYIKKVLPCADTSVDSLIREGYTKINVTTDALIYELISETKYDYVDITHNKRVIITAIADSSPTIMLFDTSASDDNKNEVIKEYIQEKLEELLTDDDVLDQFYNKVNPLRKEKLERLDKVQESIEKRIEALKDKVKNTTGDDAINYNKKIKDANKSLQKGEKLRGKINRGHGVIRKFTQIKGLLERWVGYYNDFIDDEADLSLLKVPECAYDVVPTAAYMVDEKIENLKSKFNSFYRNRFIRNAAFSATDLVDPCIPMTEYVLDQAADVESFRIEQFKNEFNSERVQIMRDIEDLKEKCNDKKNPKPKEQLQPQGGNKEPQIDPSGFVYEGVESNRLDGVTVTCYYKEMVEDMDGDVHEEIVMWKAEDYAQINPIITGKDGMFRWDVPKGMWQVKFEKEGYQTVCTEWLPVPPPQLEVNVGMVQVTQPEVILAQAYEDGIEIEFDKYMLSNLLNLSNISVVQNGDTISAEIIHLNIDDSLSSKIKYQFAEPLLSGSDVKLVVNRNVRSYANVKMGKDYTQEFEIVVRPSISAPEKVEVIYNKSNDIVLSLSNCIGKKVIASLVSTTIATITPNEAVVDENGKVTFTINGELPGLTMAQFNVEGENLSAETEVAVVRNEDRTIQRNYELLAGWNWISVNVEDEKVSNLPVLFEEVKSSFDKAISVSEELSYDEHNGFVGELSMFNVARGYKVKMLKDEVISISGKQKDMTVSLNPGWNWIGYTPQGVLPIKSAIDSSVAESGDIIMGRNSFAIYDGESWKGTLELLEPGMGYMYYSSSLKSFNYSLTDEETAIPSIEPTVYGEWVCNHMQYPDNMPVIVEIHDKNGNVVNPSQCVIGAFVGDECRGIEQNINSYSVSFLTVHGDVKNESVSFQIYDISTNTIYLAKQTVGFGDALVGSLESPFVLEYGEVLGVDNIVYNTEMSIFPNPVKDILNIKGEYTLASVKITDMSGKEVMSVLEMPVVEGIDVSSLNNGIYLITIISENGKIYKSKFVKE